MSDDPEEDSMTPRNSMSMGASASAPALNQSTSSSILARSGSSAVLSQKSVARNKKRIGLQKRVKRHQIHQAEQEIQQKDNLRKIKEQLSKKAARKEAAYQSRYNKLMNGQQFSDSLGTMLQLQHDADVRKRKKEYEEWNTNVYGELNKRISDSVNSIAYTKINERKREEYQQYLDASNVKGQIFRDIIIEDEYDPLESNRKDIKVRTHKLVDPTKRCVDRTKEEKEMIDKEKARLVEQATTGGKYTLETTLWGDLMIKATPHGHFAKQYCDGGATASTQNLKLTASDINMDHFNTQMGNEYSQAEFPLGKR
jgi:hypothetical protein